MHVASIVEEALSYNFLGEGLAPIGAGNIPGSAQDDVHLLAGEDEHSERMFARLVIGHRQPTKFEDGVQTRLVLDKGTPRECAGHVSLVTLVLRRAVLSESEPPTPGAWRLSDGTKDR